MEDGIHGLRQRRCPQSQNGLRVVGRIDLEGGIRTRLGFVDEHVRGQMNRVRDVIASRICHRDRNGPAVERLRRNPNEGQLAELPLRADGQCRDDIQT